jgi:hypothetical protein
MPFTNPNTWAMGGRASAAKLTSVERKEKARRAIKARWARVKLEKKAA